MRIKEQETPLNLHEHDDDDDYFQRHSSCKVLIFITVTTKALNRDMCTCDELKENMSFVSARTRRV